MILTSRLSFVSRSSLIPSRLSLGCLRPSFLCKANRAPFVVEINFLLADRYSFSLWWAANWTVVRWERRILKLFWKICQYPGCFLFLYLLLLLYLSFFYSFIHLFFHASDFFFFLCNLCVIFNEWNWHALACSPFLEIELNIFNNFSHKLN